ncbi:hypothetical protein V525_20540 [Gordonia alkanivorans CGMCC 6845]|uniref:Uncharacterized protein n=1 Tax=Gordonia alkanivorans CGMCC 6845 TaxID=1423140 RepID=W9D9N1_9ACTN|nr:hypothetical protein V525_20540 [Gordonia alkanivorans CGMCC 6845]
MEGEFGAVGDPRRQACDRREDRLMPRIRIGEPALDGDQLGRQIPLDGEVGRRDEGEELLDARL